MNLGRYMLITGSSKGIGRFLAEYYLGKGFTVIGCSRGESTLSADRYNHFRVDITSEDMVKSMFSKLRKDFGKLDVLINNAGVAAMNPVVLTPVTSARRIIDTNFLGPFLCSQYAIRLLRRSEVPRIVNVSSIAVPLRLEGEAVYAASKSAIETFTRILAREIAPFGITCNAVGPGPVQTDLIKGITEQKIGALLERQAIKKMSTPEDIANVIDFFLRPESNMITGQVIYLGGIG